MFRAFNVGICWDYHQTLKVFPSPMTFPGQHHLELAALRRELTREATEVSAEGLEETDAEEESEPSTVQLRQGVDLG
jgi:hypothetical protein